MIYPYLADTSRKKLAVLIDPDKQTVPEAARRARLAQESGAHLILAGGSLVSASPDEMLDAVRTVVDIPVLLFPGSLMQLSTMADAVLFLSLTSGRNADLLIGMHVTAAPFIKQNGIESISTSYILISGGNVSSVEYMSDTRPIPANKPDIAAATALAGELLGHKLVYLEAGSGAANHVPETVIRAVKNTLSIPLIVGGGIRTEASLRTVLSAGADIVVIGTAFEENSSKMEAFARIVNEF